MVHGQRRHSLSPKPGTILSERPPQKTEVICYLPDLDAAPPEWRANDVRSLAFVTTAARSPASIFADQLLAKADVIRAMHERVQLCQARRQDLPSSARVLASVESTKSPECTVTQFFKKDRPPKYSMKLGKGPSRFLPGFTVDSLEQATLSASQSGMEYKRARDVASSAHFGSLVAAKLQKLDMIQDAVTAGLIPKQHLVAPLDATIEGAALAKDTLHSKGAWQQVVRIEDLCHTTTWTHARCAGSILTPHDQIKRDSTTEPTRALASLDPQLEHGETCSTAEATRGHYACVHAVLGGLRHVDPGITGASTAAAARGKAAQAASNRKISHYRRQIPNLRGQGIVYRQ